MDIAIIGMACRFPEAESLEKFYDNLANGRDSVRKFSAKRLRNTTINDGLAYQLNGYIEDVDLFDPAFFNISPGEAQQMSPNQRLMLEVAYETFEHAGYNVEDFDGSNTSVVIGASATDYYEHADKFDPTLAIGNMSSIMAGRISRFFNLRGNAIVIDTSCSSSLVALHHACNELRLGDTDCSLVGGVSLNLFPAVLNDGYDMGVGSPDGKAKSFSAEANGTVSGEAVCCILLKPLAKAIADHDIIHAVIKSSAVNQDANLSGSLTSPSSTAQAEVITRAWEKAAINPETITFIEAHGTGTKLGDPIEIQGIDLAFRKYTTRSGFCAIASVKTNIGHTDCAAGISGLIKTVLSLKNKVLFPSLHFDKPNPFIKFENSAVYVNTTFRPWTVENNGPRRAGVSSFGLSGTNCHVVLEEYIATEVAVTEVATVQDYLFTLSAKTENSLKELIGKVRSHLLMHQDSSLKDLIYTLSAGRKQYQHRFSSVVSNSENLIALLESSQIHTRDFHQIKEQQKIVALFSADLNVSSATVLTYCNYYPLFDSFVKECIEKCPAVYLSDLSFSKFCFQYSFYKCLVACGVEVNNLLGTSQQVIQVISGKLPLEEGILMAIKQMQGEVSDIKERSRILLEKFKSDEVIFAEIGFLSSISAELENLAKGSAVHQVLYLDIENSKPQLFEYINAVYNHGAKIDWKQFYNGQQMRKVVVPAHPFEKVRCWIKDVLPMRIHDWFYELSWEKDEVIHQILPLKGKCYLIMMDKQGLGELLAASLREDGAECIEIYSGAMDVRNSVYSYTLDIGNESSYQKLYESISARDKISGLIHLGGYSKGLSADLVELESALDSGLYSQFYFAKYFSTYLNQKGFEYIMVVSNSASIVAEDEKVIAAHGASASFLKGILSAYPMLKVRGIDVDIYHESKKDVCEYILTELSKDDIMSYVGYRNSHRYVQLFKKIGYYGKSLAIENHVKEDGVYIVTGGASGIGLEICKSMSAHKRIILIVLGRTALPDQSLWNEIEVLSEEEQHRISSLKFLKQQGAEVIYFGLDISDDKAMANVFMQIGQRFKKIDGIIHSAGIGISDAELKLRSLADIKSVLAPKVQGTLLLDLYSKSLLPDFFVMFSSLNSIVPKKNSADYAAANAFQDSYCQQASLEGRRFISINWPGWLQIGAGSGVVNEDTASLGNNVLKPIRTQDGLDSFYAVLDIPRSNIAVADIDISGFISNPFFKVEKNKEVKETENLIIQPAAEVSSEMEYALDENLSLTEASVLKVWYEVLKVEDIKIDDDFFELGGHSLNSSQVINRLEKIFDVEIEFEDLFEYSTVKILSAHIDELRISGQITTYMPVIPIADQPYYELSHSQKGIWILDQMDDAQEAYNIPSCYRLKGLLNIEALEKAFTAVISKYEILRTSFELVDGEPLQKVSSAAESKFKMSYADFRTQPKTENQLKELLIEEFKIPFLLKELPLIRVSLFQLAEDEFILLFVLHHIISDNWSMDIFMKGVVDFYNSYVKDEVVNIPVKKVQYRDYAAWQHTQLNSNVKLKAYWLEKMSGMLPVLKLPADYPRPVKKTTHGNSFEFILRKELLSGVKATCRENEVSLFMFLTAVVKTLLYKYTSQQDIIIGTSIAGREHSDLEDQIGLFINTLALRTKFNPKEDNVINLLAKTKQTAMGAFDHQLYPLNKLVEDLNINRDRSRSSLFDVMITLYNKEAEEGGKPVLDGIVTSEFNLTLMQSQLDLSFDFTEKDGEIHTRIEYNTDIFNRIRIEKMERHLEKIINVFTNSPFEKIESINIYSARESEVIKIWAAAMGIPVSAISLDGDFFDLGGDTIAAEKIVSSINNQYELDLTTECLNLNSTVRKFINYLEETEDPTVSIVPEIGELRNYRRNNSV